MESILNSYILKVDLVAYFIHEIDKGVGMSPPSNTIR